MSRIFSRHSANRVSPKTLKVGLVPVTVEVFSGGAAVVAFSDGSTSKSSCLRCETAPCMTYADTEVVSVSLADFPADRNPSVCPANAIVRENGAAPVISPDACMLCGVCASRCPVGAIRMVPYAVVDDTQREAFPETESLAESLAALSVFAAVPRIGEFLVESDAIVDDMRSRLLAAWNRIGDRFPDHLARNLLIASGAGAAMRRKGDNAARMDIALGAPWPAFGCAEAEFGDVAVLDAPRDLMDDVAVCVGRLGKDKDSIVALVVTDVLPNRRSEYWRILQDVRKILGVKIGTVTVLALCLLVWRGKKISALPIDLFHVDVETESYRAAVLEPLLGRKLKIGLEPRPSVDVAK
jgi:Fe-S-cluster-containing hydrogenase component 2